MTTRIEASCNKISIKVQPRCSIEKMCYEFNKLQSIRENKQNVNLDALKKQVIYKAIF